MRCFIAIDISDEARKALADVIEKLGQKQKGIRWIKPENIHITLKFLGETSEELVPDIISRLSSIFSGHVPFTITVRGTGVFPSIRNPNVLWTGIDESKDLKYLTSLIEDSMAELGFEKETRDFSPHLTIGRVKDRRGAEPVITELYAMQDTLFGTVPVGEAFLMKSVLKAAGAEYSKVAVFKLASFPFQT